MKIVVNLLSAAAFAGFGASTFVHIRGLTGAAGDAWPLVVGVFSAGVALTLTVVLASWRIGSGRADGWWSRAMDGLSTWTYLAVAGALVYGIGVIGYTLWSQRGGRPSVHTPAIVAGATFMFFYAVLFAAARSLGIAARTDRVIVTSSSSQVAGGADESPELAELAEAVILWTGWGRSAWPHRDRAPLVDRFGSEGAVRLLERIQCLESEFYETDANQVAAGLVEMGSLAEARFNGLHPDLPEIIGRAFAWCYTFDFK